MGFPNCASKKKDGTMRFCVDYRKLNKASQMDAYSIIACKLILHMYCTCTYIDLTSRYFIILSSSSSLSSSSAGFNILYASRSAGGCGLATDYASQPRITSGNSSVSTGRLYIFHHFCYSVTD